MTPAERPYSLIEGRDPDVLRILLGFYQRPEKGMIVDVTANRRKMWSGLDTSGVTFCDVDEQVRPDIVCDFRSLPFADGSASLIVFDPPHLPAAAASPRSLGQYQRDYNLLSSGRGDNPHAWFAPFLAEAKRVLLPGGLVFAKLCDFVHNHRYQWAIVDFVNAVRQVDGLTACDLIVKRDPCGGNLKSGRWVTSHHVRRCHSWFVVVRKGKCEPSERCDV